MTNGEKYRDEILKIVKTKEDFAVKDGKIEFCCNVRCNYCEFFDGDCTPGKIRWMYAEALPTLTRRERAFCEYVCSGYIARDMSGDLYWHSYKPEKFENFWSTPEDFDRVEYADFEFIKWEDEEPWSVKDLLRLEVEE